MKKCRGFVSENGRLERHQYCPLEPHRVGGQINLEMIIYYNFYNAVGLLLVFNENYLLQKVNLINKLSDNNLYISNKHYDYFINFLDNYFSTGSILDFSKLDTSGLSCFSLDVYTRLSKTKVGETITYKKLAADSGFINAYRAVGRTMAKNRWPIFIPCHRVVGQSSLGGYSGGIDLKKKLLELEKKHI